MFRKKEVTPIDYRDELLITLNALLQENSSNGIIFYEIQQDKLLNSELLSLLMIRGQYAYDTCDFKNYEIYNALYNAKQYLNVYIRNHEYFPWCEETIKMIRPLSPRQIYCSNLSVSLIMSNKYISALHEFMDCIDDNGKGRYKIISLNEYALYNCVLTCFMARLEENTENIGLIPKPINDNLSE